MRVCLYLRRAPRDRADTAYVPLGNAGWCCQGLPRIPGAADHHGQPARSPRRDARSRLPEWGTNVWYVPRIRHPACLGRATSYLTYGSEDKIFGCGLGRPIPITRSQSKAYGAATSTICTARTRWAWAFECQHKSGMHSRGQHFSSRRREDNKPVANGEIGQHGVRSYTGASSR